MRKQKRKVTVNTLSDTSGIDRRTVKKRLIENGNYPPGKHSLSDCLKAIRPPGSGSTLENARARLLDAKVRAIEREERLSGGDVLPTEWFTNCVREAFRDRFSFGNFEQLYADSIAELKCYGSGFTRDEYEKNIIGCMDKTFKSLRTDVEKVRDRLITHLREGTASSGGRTSLADVDDYIREIAKRLSESAKAELRAALASTQTSNQK